MPIPCPHCENGSLTISLRGGNDPSVRLVECEECFGDGVMVCEGTRWCGTPAEYINDDNEKLCTGCFAEWRAGCDEEVVFSLAAE